MGRVVAIFGLSRGKARQVVLLERDEEGECQAFTGEQCTNEQARAAMQLWKSLLGTRARREKCARRRLEQQARAR